jgi:predicted MFS family arabinose efflux permease
VEHAWVYLPVLVVALVIMVPMIIMAESKGKMRPVFLMAISGVMLSGLMLGLFHNGMVAVVSGLLLFFIAYNVLEATLPSLISRMAPIDAKGTAMGVYSTAQFFGAFLGGSLGGWGYGEFGVTGVFIGCSLAMLAWLILAFGQRMPAMRSTQMAHVDGTLVEDASALEKQLLALAGVAEARVVAEENAVFLRVDKKVFDEEAMKAILPGH